MATGPSDSLLMALAQAKAQPDRWARDVNEGANAGKDILGGYISGLQAKNEISQLRNQPQINASQRQSAMLENYGKLASAIGPDRAIQLMGPSLESAGIDTSKLPASSVAGGTETPQQLMGEGDYGKNQLGMRKTAEDIQNNAPYSLADVKGMLPNNPEVVSALSQAYPNGGVPSRVVQNAISGLSANRLTGMIATKQFSLLPSQSGASTAAGAAYQVKVAARQGKSLIAKASTPQALALASADLSRAVQRAAPVAETIGAGNYASSLPTLYSQFQQKLTSDPNGPDVPKMRKAMYDQFDELDKAATPWIANHLQNMEDSGTSSTFGNNWNSVKQRELGQNIPEIPFQDTSASNPNIASGVPQYRYAKNAQGQTVRSADNWATVEPVQ